MGLLDVFRSTTEEIEEIPDETVYKILREELSNWFDEQFSEKINSSKKSVNDIRSRVMDYFSETRENFLDLEKSKFESNDRVSAIANMTKNSYVKHSLSIIGKLRFPEIESYSELKRFNTRIISTIREINKLTPKQAVLLNKYFSNESSRFAKNLKKIEGTTREIKEFLESDGKIIEMSEKFKINAEQLSHLIKQSQELGKDEKDIRADLERLDISKKEMNEKIATLLKSSEWNKMKGFEEMVQNGNSELDGIERETNEILNNAKRPFKKLRYLLESKESFPENPFRMFILGNREDNFSQQIEAAKTNASEGKITLKPKENEKLLRVSDYMEKEIPKIKKRYIVLREASKTAREQISNSQLYKEKATIDEDLSKIEIDLETKWSELNSKIQERKQIESETLELKKESEKLVLELGKKLEIKLS